MHECRLRCECVALSALALPSVLALLGQKSQAGEDLCLCMGALTISRVWQ